MLKIGNYSLKSKLVLAPLSGCTDLPYRTIARAHGCKFAFYEMLDAHGLTYGAKRTLSMLETTPKDNPIGVQILGHDPDRVLEAANIILDNSKPVILDLNFACPAKKVLKKKCGSYLLKDPKQVGKIIKKLTSSLSIPITVKIRSSFDGKNPLEGLILAKTAQENGASAVFMHGRTCMQCYGGKVNYEAIKEVKEALKIPLFGSGDILSPQLAQEMLDNTNCDGLLVARGSFGNPWIFEQIEAYLKDPKIPPSSVSYEKIISIAKEHLKLYKDWRKNTKEKYMTGHLRKIAMWYSKGLPYSKRAREAISQAKNYDDIIDVLDRLNHDYDKGWMKR